MTGLEPLVVGLIVGWFQQRAQHVGDRLGEKVDQAADEGIGRLWNLLRGKIGGHPAVRQLEQEAGEGVDNPRTRKRQSKIRISPDSFASWWTRFKRDRRSQSHKL